MSVKKLKDEITLYGFLIKISSMIKAVSIYKQIIRKRQISLIEEVIQNLNNTDPVQHTTYSQNYIIFSLSYLHIYKYIQKFIGNRNIKVFIVTSPNIMKTLLSKIKSVIHRLNMDYFIVNSTICRKFDATPIELEIIQKIKTLFDVNYAYIVSNKYEYFAIDSTFTSYYLDVNKSTKNVPIFKLILLKEIKKIFMEINILDATNSDSSIEESTKRRSKLASKIRMVANTQSQNYNQV